MFFKSLPGAPSVKAKVEAEKQAPVPPVIEDQKVENQNFILTVNLEKQGGDEVKRIEVTVNDSVQSVCVRASPIKVAYLKHKGKMDWLNDNATLSDLGITDARAMDMVQKDTTRQ
jgi:hypothetical protein